MTTVKSSVLLTHAVGLHARPSVKLTKLAKRFASRIELATSPKGPWIDAKSIVKVMSAKIPHGTRLHFQASGSDSEAAAEALVELVSHDFEDGHPDAATG